MKRIIMTFSVALAAIFGIGAAAQCPATDCPTACPEPCQAPDCRPARCGAASGECRAFEGITLTDAQKQKLAEIRTTCRRAAKACDSTARAARRASRIDNLRKVKGVLTPEQYVTFLENMAVSGSAPHHGMKAGRHHRDGRFARDGRRAGSKACPVDCPKSRVDAAAPATR